MRRHRNRRNFGHEIKKIFLTAIGTAVALSVVTGAAAMVSPTINAWIKSFLYPPEPKSNCLPDEIIGNGYSIEPSILVGAADKAYWHYNPEKDNQYIPDHSSPDANSWRWLYMQELACRLEERTDRGMPNSDIDINRALHRIGIPRREFEYYKPRLLRSGEDQSGRVASDELTHSHF